MKKIYNEKNDYKSCVASYTEAWIENKKVNPYVEKHCWSLPIRRRGLKKSRGVDGFIPAEVASYTEAWIEICKERKESLIKDVAPYMEVWIEN